MLTRGSEQQSAGAYSVARAHRYFAGAALLAVGLYWQTLKSLLTFALRNDIYFYSAVLPVITAVLISLERKRIFVRVRHDWAVGGCLIFTAFAIRFCNDWYATRNTFLSLAMLSFLVLWAGAFVLCYGTSSLRAAAFHLSLLILMVPLPAIVLERAIFVLRSCSAQTASWIFRLEGVPFFRSGFRFSLPGLDLEVAEQCSGIRSGLSFLVTSLLVGHLFLRSACGKLGLVLAAFPITVLKNGLRIATIYGLSIHPSLAPILPWVHRYGGIPFSFVGLGFLAMAVSALRKMEEASQAGGNLMGGGLAAQESAACSTLKLTCL